MRTKKLTPPQIAEKLLDVNEGWFARFGMDEVRRMAKQMYYQKDHPGWEFIN